MDLWPQWIQEMRSKWEISLFLFRFTVSSNYKFIDPMIDNVLNFGPTQTESYYFQLIPLDLSIVGKGSMIPAVGTTYRFIISKGLSSNSGQQKFDENKFPVIANFQRVNKIPTMGLSNIQLNFFLPTYNKLRKQQFIFKLIQNEQGQDFDIGEYKIDTNSIIQNFKKNRQNKFEFKSFFSDDYEINFEVYVEKSKLALERVVAQRKTARTAKTEGTQRTERTQKSASKKQTSPVKDNKPSEANKTGGTVVQAPRSFSKLVDDSRGKTTPANSESRIDSASKKNQKQRSQKNQINSSKSGDKVPLIQTRFKQLSAANTPSQVKIRTSTRLSTNVVQQPTSSSPGPNSQLKQKVFIWIFLIVGIIVMYFSMHPNKKV